LKADDAIVVAKYKGRLVEAWNKDFEVLWRIEVYEDSKIEIHFTEANLMLICSNALVMRSYDSCQCTTVINNQIGKMHIESGQQQLVLNCTTEHKLVSSWTYKLSWVMGLLYYLDVVTDLALLGIYYSTGHYLIFALAVALIFTPNIIEVKESPHRTVGNTFAKLFFVDQIFALHRDIKNPTYFKERRDTGKELSDRITKETAIESIPQTLISLYFILATEDYSVLPLVALGSSLLCASFATSFGLKQPKGFSLLLILFCYRVCEILLRVMILGLSIINIYIYFAPAFLAVSIGTQFLIYFFRGTTSWEQAFDHFTRSGIDSFVYVSGFTKEKSPRFMLGHQVTNFLINLSLIFVLQLQAEVVGFWVASMWSLIASQFVFFLVLRRFWKKDKENQQ
jgi:hypothetical protein